MDGGEVRYCSGEARVRSTVLADPGAMLRILKNKRECSVDLRKRFLCDPPLPRVEGGREQGVPVTMPIALPVTMPVAPPLPLVARSG